MEARFLLGIDSIDEQHGKLFEILGRVYDALIADDVSAGPILSSAVAELLEYAKLHFASEETIMEAAGYPGQAAHSALHQDLLAQLSDVEVRAESEGQYAPTELADYLHAWLTDHILAEDRAFTEYVQIADAASRR